MDIPLRDIPPFVGHTPSPFQGVGGLYPPRLDYLDVLLGAVHRAGLGLGYAGHHVEPFDHFAEHGVLAVEVGRAAHGLVVAPLLGGEAPRAVGQLRPHLGQQGVAQRGEGRLVAVATVLLDFLLMLPRLGLEEVLLRPVAHVAFHHVQFGIAEGAPLHDVELAAGGGFLRVHLVALAGGGHGPALVVVARIDELGGHGVAHVAMPERLAGAGIARLRVARLYHEVGDDAVEQHPVVEAVVHQFHEVVAVLWRFGVELQHDVAAGGFEPHLGGELLFRFARFHCHKHEG